MNDRGFECFVCKESIAPDDEHGCTVLINRRLITSERQIKSPQFIWAHDSCLVRLIPLAEYTFPELKQR
jgi:hypothetical protein